MNRNVRQMGVRLVAAAILAAVICFQSLAATARIAFSDPSTQVGQEFSVTMKFTSTSGDMLGDTDVMLAYDASALEFISGSGNVSGGTGAIRVKSAPAGATEAATELRFKALKAGTTTITISSWEGYDNDGQVLNVEREGTSTITVRGLETSSSDATLKSLQVSPGSLSPAFTPGQEAYTVEVGLETARLTVSAEANNDKAVVAVEGGDNLQEGENTVVCRVTAEDGTTTKSYTLTVNKVEGGENAANPAETTAPEPEILAEVDMKPKKIRVISLPEGVEVPAGFRDTTIKIGDTRVLGWVWAADESAKYCVLYGMNEDGEQNFYRYDLEEETLQRYFEDPNSSSGFSDEQFTALAEDYNSLLEDFRICQAVMFAACAAAVVLLIVLIVVAVKASSRRTLDGGMDGEYDGRQDEQQYRPEPKTVHAAGGRKLSKEERYMMGEEEEYEEEDGFESDMDMDAGVDAYQPEPAKEEAPVSGPEAENQGTASAGAEEDMERKLAQELAKEAAVTAEPADGPDDDFEFFDLDE